MSLLALRKSGANPSNLIGSQRRCGAWSEFESVGSPSAFHTALSLLAIHPYRIPTARSAAERGFRWLNHLQGRESHWLWQWKFRLFDRQVRFDPMKSGWPWVPDTASWTAPTALSILAFQAWRRQSPRLRLAIDMLVDRACRGGGWNAGNSVVFGVSLDPHPDFTAMALLALRSIRQRHRELAVNSLDYLEKRLHMAGSPYSLSWAVLALAAYGHPTADPLRARLANTVALRLDELPPRVLALAALALEDQPFTFFGEPA